MDPIVSLLNALLAKNLPTINTALRSAIITNHLDPLLSVTSGADSLGSIDLGLCTASADVNYWIANLTGLAGVSIQTLQIAAAAPVHDSPTAVSGTISLHGTAGGMSAQVGGKLKAGCGFISQSIDLSGRATISSASVTSGGDFMATSQNGQLVLTHLDVEDLAVNYQNLNVAINGLGIFNSMSGSLEGLLISQFNGKIRSAIASAITPIINAQLDALLPLSASL